MTVDEVEREMMRLKTACQAIGVTQFNRFYFHSDQIVFNVTTYDGWIASARMEGTDLVIRRSDKRTKNSNARVNLEGL